MVNRRNIRSLFTALALAACQSLALAGGPNSFEFIAIGDMPYKLPDDYAKFDRLIAAINTAKPSFSVHVGDIKSSATPCTDEIYGEVLKRFQAFDSPLLYTPGDNEWTDCHRPRAGGYDPVDRLKRVRELFFPDPTKTLGKTQIAVESQSRLMPQKYGAFVENARFVKNGVLFVTVHLVGSNNNFEPRNRATVTEYFERNEANIAWIDANFAKAKAENVKAMVIMAQADLYDLRQQFPAIPYASGYNDTIQAIERGAKIFDRPLLYIHGDEHRFVVDRLRGTNYKPISKAKRLQVYGETQVHGVRVIVDPDTPGVFGYIPLIVPENGEY